MQVFTGKVSWTGEGSSAAYLLQTCSAPLPLSFLCDYKLDVWQQIKGREVINFQIDSLFYFAAWHKKEAGIECS